MGIRVWLEREDGARVDEIIDPQNLLGHMLPGMTSDYQLIRYIDPYGETVFNEFQMTDFLSDWQRMYTTERSAKERELLERVRLFADRCRAQPGLLLRFSGD